MNYNITIIQQELEKVTRWTSSLGPLHESMRFTPKLNEEDIETGPVLGRGASGVVRKVIRIHSCNSQTSFFKQSIPYLMPTTRLNTKRTEGDESDLDSTDSSITTTSMDEDYTTYKTTPPYVIKQLRDDLCGDQQLDSMICIATEAQLLSRLSHPNIVRLSATCGVPGDSGFGLVLERLSCTLKDQCKVWKRYDTKVTKNGYFLPFTKNQKVEKKALWSERLRVLSELASAVEYLHNHSIIYRDLKPENVAFDAEGNTKLIDFGLATIVDTDNYRDNNYILTGRTGSRRYMAPEVFKCLPYTLSADSFSFAILSWEILCLKLPFENFNLQKHSQHVYVKQKRLTIPLSWPKAIKELVRECWSHDPQSRWSFGHIHEVLRNEYEC